MVPRSDKRVFQAGRACPHVAALVGAVLCGGAAPADPAKPVGGKDLAALCQAFTPKPEASNVSLQVAYQAPSDKQGAHCVVRGEVVSSPTSTIKFRVDLPDPPTWNQRLMGVGGGGFDGIVPTEGPMGFWFAKVLGPDGQQLNSFATFSSDSGHQARGAHPIADFSWVAANPSALRNHAYEANHIVLGIASSLVKQFYGEAPKRRYIIGGSNGGRAGMVAIQRYPDDYDGVVALEPAISQEGFGANLGPELLQYIFSDPQHWLNTAQIALYEKAELEACDALDGLKDGILSNATVCGYTGENLLCSSANQDPNSCLTAGQIESIRRIHMDKRVNVTLADGIVGYPGWGRGAESSEWPDYMFGPSFAAREAADYVLADNIVKWGVTDDPNASVMTHDPTKWAKQYLALSEEIDATNPDLEPFHRHGGKLIVWYGISDACVSYRRTAEYLGNVSAKLGSKKAGEFIRFYTSPATGHEMAGPGAGSAPLLTTLTDWVEKGRVPAEALEFTLADQPTRHGATRPLCQYPKFPRYKGSGDPNRASSFSCVTE
jgi:feruloyl esterase